MSYIAFLSYTSGDRVAARRLFRKIDGYRPPKKLVGVEGRHGAVPSVVYPVFQDRLELPTAPDLNDAIMAALRSSKHLIVLCSPAAAQSQWVNREIELFSSMHGNARIHAVILEGDVESAAPPALKSLGSEYLAADLTEAGDGWDYGVIKLLAGVLGVAPSALRDRELARQRWRTRGFQALAATFMAISAVSIYQYFQAEQSRKRALAFCMSAVDARNLSVSNLSVVVDALGDVTSAGASTSFRRTMLAAVQEIESPPEIATAEDGEDCGPALNQLEVYWKNEVKIPDLAAQLEISLENFEAAQKLLEVALERAKAWRAHSPSAATDRNYGVILSRLGFLRYNLKQYESALEAYAEAEQVRRSAFDANPDDFEAVRGLSATLYGLARTYRQLKKTEQFERYADEQVTLDERALALAPDNRKALARSDLSASLDLLGDALLARDKLDQAVLRYERARNLAEENLALDPKHLNHQYGLAFRQDALADAYVKANRAPEARNLLADSLQTFAAMHCLDPADADRRSNFEYSLGRLRSDDFIAALGLNVDPAWSDALQSLEQGQPCDPAGKSELNTILSRLRAIGAAPN